MCIAQTVAGGWDATAAPPRSSLPASPRPARSRLQAPSGAVGQLAKRERGAKTHCCSSCNFPIAAYGRCAPCLHVFCLACAADMATCRM
jgi:hypothetical protein